ncbi:NrtA/SsuA/CpmA family ABC transporter substrate-binding protein [Cyanobacteria bacterium FACHB-472]|nr:NrtA/SsuA/CpmA family ABC transporter substrate-binding protein [Cyanobacteria bacterium FACHB-472]
MAISRRSLIKRLTYTLVLPSISCVLFACAGTQRANHSKGNNQTDSKAAIAVNQVEGETVPIRIAYPAGMNGQIAKVMEKAKITEKKGLEAKYTFFQNGPPMMEAFTSGEIDAAISSPMPVINFMSRNPGKAVVVASLGNSSYSLMVPKDSSIKQVKDLQGKKIALSFGSDSHVDLLRLLKESNLNPKSDVKLLNTQPNELQQAFERKFADAIVIRQPQVLKMQKKLDAQIVHTWPHRYISIMRTDYLQKYPQAKKKYLEALQESILFTATNKEQASLWFSEQIRVDPETIRQVSKDDPNYTVTKLENVSVEVTPALQQTLEDWAKFSYEAGIIKKEVAWKWK